MTAPSSGKRARPLMWALGLAVIGFLAAYVWASFGTYWAIRSAVRWNDTAALAQLIDYDQVRASLRPQLIDPVGARAVELDRPR